MENVQLSGLPSTVKICFHFQSRQIADRLNLEGAELTPAQAQQIEDARKQFDRKLRLDRADMGIPVLNKNGETNLSLYETVEDLAAAGYRIVDAFIRPKYKWVNGVNTGLKGHVTQMVFSNDTTIESMFEDPTQAVNVLAELKSLLKNFTSPLTFVWANHIEGGVRTCDTINVSALSREDERAQMFPNKSALRRDPQTGSYRIAACNFNRA